MGGAGEGGGREASNRVSPHSCIANSSVFVQPVSPAAESTDPRYGSQSISDSSIVPVG